MADPYLSVSAGEAMDLAVDEITYHIRIAPCYEGELRSLNCVVERIMPINSAIRQYRLALKSDPHNALPLVPEALNEWLNKLNKNPENARDMVELCIVPTYDMISHYQLCKKTTGVITDIEVHLKDAALVGIANQSGQNLTRRRIDEGIARRSTSSTTPALASSLRHTQRWAPCHKPHSVIGQDDEFKRLRRLLIDVEDNSPSPFGVVGLGGAGKTLLLRRLYNCRDVQHHFGKKLVLLITVSQYPYFLSLRIELVQQLVAECLRKDSNPITREVLVNHIIHKYGSTVSTATLTEDEFEERVRRLIDGELWESGQDNLLESLRVPRTNNSKVAVSSRDRRALLSMGVKSEHMIGIQGFSEDDAWRLFCIYDFPYNKESPPQVGRTWLRMFAESIMDSLLIEVTGAAMAGVTSLSEWELTLQRLHNAEKFHDDV